MQLRERIRVAASIVRGSWTPFTLGNARPHLGWLRGGSESNGSGLYAAHGVFSQAVEIVAQDAASISWCVVDRSGERLEAHPVLDVLAHPALGYSGSELFEATYLTFLLYGEAFWYYPELVLARPGALAASGAGSMSAGIELIHPTQVEHDATPTGQLAWFRRTSKGRVPLGQDRMTHFRRYDPEQPGNPRGVPMVTSILREIYGDVAAADWNQRFFSEQNGVPTGVIKTSVEFPSTPTAREEFRRGWADEHGSRRGVGMLPPGWDFADIGATQRDMDFTGLRSSAREHILARIGVPPFYGGVLDKANYANSREQKQVYWDGTIPRFMARFESRLNESFLRNLGVRDVRITPNWDKVQALLEDMVQKSTVAEAWHRIGLSKRVINERLGMGWEADAIEDYDVGYLPMGLVPVDQVGDLDTDPNDPFAADPDADPGEPDEDDAKAYRRPQIHRSEAARATKWRAIAFRSLDLERALEGKIRGHFKALESEVLSNVRQLKGLVAVRRGHGDLGFDKAKADVELTQKTKIVRELAVRRGAEGLLAELSSTVAWNVFSTNTLTLLAQLQQRIRGINDTVERVLRSSLAEGLVAGESPDQLAARVGEVFGVAMKRARTIARTETCAAFNGGRVSAMRDVGVTRHEWLAARDEKVRDSHKAADGQVVEIGQTFPGVGIAYPGDPAGPPEEVINCRCTVVPVIGGRNE